MSNIPGNNSKYLRLYAEGLRVATQSINAVWHMRTGKIDDSLAHVEQAIKYLEQIRRALLYFKNTDAGTSNVSLQGVTNPDPTLPRL